MGIEETVKIVFEGQKGKQEFASTLIQSMNRSFNEALKKIGILVSIWQAFDVFIRPILNLFKLLMILLFLPMLPLLKQMLNSMKETADKVKKAQTAAGGTGMGAFGAGIGALVTSPTIWALAGASLAAAFIANLGLAKLAGGILTTIGLSLIWDILSKGDKKTLETKLIESGWAALAIGLAALAFGAGIYSLAIGALVFTVLASYSFFSEAFKAGDIKKAILLAGAGSLGGGIIAGAIALLVGAGATAAGLVTLTVGTILFSVTTGFIFGKKKAEEEKAIESMKSKTEEAAEKTSFLSKIWGTFKESMSMGAMATIFGPLSLLGFLIGSSTKGSYPIVYSINAANQKWIEMKSTSVTAINEIILALNRIPKEIVTIHRIVTVYGGKK